MVLFLPVPDSITPQKWTGTPTVAVVSSFWVCFRHSWGQPHPLPQRHQYLQAGSSTSGKRAQPWGDPLLASEAPVPAGIEVWCQLVRALSLGFWASKIPSSPCSLGMLVAFFFSQGLCVPFCLSALQHLFNQFTMFSLYSTKLRGGVCLPDGRLPGRRPSLSPGLQNARAQALLMVPL